MDRVIKSFQCNYSYVSVANSKRFWHNQNHINLPVKIFPKLLFFSVKFKKAFSSMNFNSGLVCSLYLIAHIVSEYLLANALSTFHFHRVLSYHPSSPYILPKVLQNVMPYLQLEIQDSFSRTFSEVLLVFQVLR